ERESTERWAMLSKVSAGLAEILHADTKLEDVLRLLVPQFADWCSVHLVEEDGIRRAAVVHANPEIEMRVRQRLSEVRFVADARRLFEESASANWVATPDGRIVACNQMFAQLLGFSSIDEAMNAPADELYSEPAERHRLIDELRSQRRLSGRETAFKRHDNDR